MFVMERLVRALDLFYVNTLSDLFTSTCTCNQVTLMPKKHCSGRLLSFQKPTTSSFNNCPPFPLISSIILNILNWVSIAQTAVKQSNRPNRVKETQAASSLYISLPPATSKSRELQIPLLLIICAVIRWSSTTSLFHPSPRIQIRAQLVTSLEFSLNQSLT